MDPKIQSCLFCLKIGAHSISKMQIANPDLEFWNSDLKTYFWANFGRNSQSCLLFLKIAMHGILTMLILIPKLVFWIANPKFILGKFGLKNSKLFVLPKISQNSTYTHSISNMLILILILVFWKYKPKSSGWWFLSCH